LTEWLSLASWHTGRYFRNLFRPQSSPNLDTLRNTSPALPDPPNGTNVTPPTGYDDPKPTATANFNSYYTLMSSATGDAGVAGSKPLQLADPTAGGAVAGGVSVNLDSRNFSFSTPLIALPGRAGLNLSLALTYNSRVWNSLAYNADKGFPGPGWRIFGAIQGVSSSGNVGPYSNSTTGKQSFLYITPDGTRHDLAYNSTSGLYESYDSSYLDFNSATKVLRATDGTKMTFGEAATANGDYQFLPTQIKDRNGNFITIVYKTLSNNDKVIDYLTDTLSRRIDFYYENNRLREIRQTRGATIFKHAIIDYEPVTITLGSGISSDPSTLNGAQVYLPTRVTYPTGGHLRFYYTSYGQIWRIEKWVPGVTGQGIARQIAATTFDLPSVNQVSFPSAGSATPAPDNGITGWQGGAPAFSSRSDAAENWPGSFTQYQYNIEVSGWPQPYNKYHRVTGPTGEYRLYYELPLNRSMAWIDPVASVTIKNESTNWTKDTGVSYTSNARVTDATVSDPGGNSRTTSFTYTQSNSVWLVSSLTEPFRRTDTTYTHYPTQRIIGLPAQVSVYDNTGATLVSRTNFTYDETSSFTDSNGQSAPYFINETAANVVQHDNTNYGFSFTQRGNLTTSTQHGVLNGAPTGNTRIVKRTAWDTNGNLRSETDGAGNRKQLLYTDNFSNKPVSVGATQAYPYTVADPTGFRQGKQYDYWQGNILTSFLLRAGSSTQEQLVTSVYDFADRIIQSTPPTGAWVKTAYWDNLLYTTTTTKIDQVGSTDQTAFGFKLAGGAGRVLQQGNNHLSGVAGKYSGQKFVYNNKGELTDLTNVTAINADWTPIDEDAGGWLFRNYVYDAQGRPKEITDFDAARIQYDYTGCGCAGGAVVETTDQRGCRIKSEMDSAGRLWKSSEMYPDPNSGAWYEYNKAIYTYDALDRITEVRVEYYNYPVGNSFQLRTFVYDEYGRLQSETTPEAGTVSYTYKPNDQINTRTDARGKVAAHTYNTRTLLTGISYNDSGATPSVTYGYDDYGARTSMSDGEGTLNYYYNSVRRLDHETRSFTGLPGKYYRLNYTWNPAGQPKQVSYVATTTAGALPVTESEYRIASLDNQDSGLQPPAAPVVVATQPQPAVTPRTGDDNSVTLKLKRTGKQETWRPSLSFSKGLSSLWNLLSHGRELWVTNKTESKRSGAANYTLVGYVRTAQGQGVDAATVSLFGAGPSPFETQTMINGEYQFINQPEGTYDVSVSKTNWSFTPASQQITLDRDIWDLDFTATPTAFSITGKVTDSQGLPAPGVLITVTGSATQYGLTDSYGNYTLPSVPASGNYTLTPSKNGYVFTPQTRSYTNLNANQTNVNFTAAPAPPPPPPSGPQTWTKNVNYAYNSVGALLSVGTNLTGTDPNATTNVLSNMAYNGFGATKSLNYGNGRRMTLGYSGNRHQMVSMVVDNQNGTDPIISRTYEYSTTSYPDPPNNDGRIKKINDLLDPNYTTTYTWDEFNRLSLASAPAFYRSYWYDPFGNLKGVQNGFGNPTLSYSFPLNASGAPATNRMSSVIYGGTVLNTGWDASGNLTSEGGTTYSYDAAGRLKEVGTGGQNTYRYDGDSQRVKVVASGTTTYYVRSSVLGQVAMEVAGSSAVLQRAYVYASGKLVAEQSNDGGFYWLHGDHLGSARKLTNTSGVVVYRGEFDPHGQPLLETGTTTLNSRKFTGYERDWATGLDYANARMYQSSRGRFTSPDPAGMSSADKRVPESFNRYAYAGNDPVNHVDPGGEDWFDWLFQFASICYSQGSSGFRLNYDVLNDTYDLFCDGRRARELLTKAALEALGEWSRPKPRLKKILTAIPVVKPPDKVECGQDIVFIVQWEIFSLTDIDPTDFKGAVVQHVNFRLVRNNQENPTEPFWEAWRYRYGAWQDNNGQDNFILPGTATFRSFGELTVRAYARFYEDLEGVVSRWGRLPSDYPSGDLPATINEPSFWIPGGLEHTLVVKWECVLKGEVTIIERKP
jgi:RHS repeat-associated protein